MTTDVVVLSAGRIPDAETLEGVRILSSLSCRVTLVCRRMPSSAQVDLFDAVHVLGRGRVTAADLQPTVKGVAETVGHTALAEPDERRPRPPLPRLVVRKVRDEARSARRWARATRRRAVGSARRSRVSAVSRLPELARRVRGNAPPSIGPQLRKDPQATHLLDKADLVVALDQGGVRVAWFRTRRSPAGAVLGLPAAVWWVQQRITGQE